MPHCGHSVLLPDAAGADMLASAGTVFRQLALHLEKEHAQIRLAVLQLLDVLFMRSHVFRTLVAEKFQFILNLCLGSPDKPLPRPKHHAVLLKELALRCVQRWDEKYGKRFKPLELGSKHVADRFRVRFEASQELRIPAR